MQNKVQDGKVIPFTAAAAHSSGDTVKVGSLIGVACGDVVNGETGQLALEGVYTLVKNSGEAWTAGAPLYWDASNSEWTTTETSNTLGGFAAAAADSAATTGSVLLARAVVVEVAA